MSSNDAKIKNLLNKIEEQQSLLPGKPKVNWITNGIFKYNKENIYKEEKGYFNLNTVKNPQILVDALAFLLHKEISHKEACVMLEIEFNPILWEGYPISAWITDFKKRIEIIKWEEKKSQLDEMKKKLNSLVSEEAKTEIEISNIESMLS